MSITPGTEARITDASDASVLVSFGDQVTIPTHSGMLRLFRSFLGDPVRGVTNLHPAYSSLLIEFDPLRIAHGDLKGIIQQRMIATEQSVEPAPATVTIPVCYSQEYGPDLSDVAKLHDLSIPDVIELHSGVLYTVYFLGFVPGFAYLGMLSEHLATPRLPSPRKQVPRGSVGIADRQTGVYPVSTPGGWRLLGRTPVTLFDPARQGLSLLQPGDRVRFQPISQNDFHAYGAR